ncbi:unnamed protein product, partial [Bubo scandiacus]
MLGWGAAGGCGLLVRAASRALSLSHGRPTVVVERWWQVPLSKEGRPPRLHPRRHRVYRLLEDTKHRPKEELELILTQAVEGLGHRGDVVSVRKSLGRNKLPAAGAWPCTPRRRTAGRSRRRGSCAGKGAWRRFRPRAGERDRPVPQEVPPRGGDEEQRPVGAEQRDRGAALLQKPAGFRAAPRAEAARGAHHALGRVLVRRHGERAGHGAGAHGRGAVPAAPDPPLQALAGPAAGPAGGTEGDAAV